MLDYEVRPLTNRHEFPGKRQPSRFEASWSTTLDLLEREINALRGRDVVIEVDVLDTRWIRNDGRLRSDAKVHSPAVRVVFDSKHGPLQYATDVFPTWQANVRAIALGLEALRRVDRYGIAKRGEQYTGWKQLTAGPLAIGDPTMRITEAMDVLIAAAECDDREAVALDRSRLYKRARIRAHPDRHGGDQTVWDQVEAAGRVLGVS